MPPAWMFRELERPQQHRPRYVSGVAAAPSAAATPTAPLRIATWMLREPIYHPRQTRAPYLNVTAFIPPPGNATPTRKPSPPSWLFWPLAWHPRPRRLSAVDSVVPCTLHRVMVDLDLDGNNLIQPSVTGARTVVGLEQLDAAEAFTDHIGTSAADGSASLSSNTGELGACVGKIRIEINGVTYWLRAYADHT